MAYKEYREIKVCEQSGHYYKPTPTIILRGNWLQELGFEIDTPITVKCEDGRLIITKSNEIWVELVATSHNWTGPFVCSVR